MLALSRPAAAQQSCFERLDTGVDMTGWQKSATNPHGPGDGWTVEDGAFVGRQTSGQQGGILMTDRSYGDVEVIFEVRIDWGCDSGFFFRTTAGARAYQVTIDHLAESGVGTIWGEGFSPELREIPYFLTDQGDAAVVAPNQSKTPIFDLATWPAIWDPTAFNEIRARIEGNPPHLQVWISGTKVMDFTDAMVRSDVDATGPLAIQVHSGSRWIQDGTVAFKNIRARDLSVTCEEPGGAGASGMAGSAGTNGAGTGGGGASGGGAGTAQPGGAGGVAGGAGMTGEGGALLGGSAGAGDPSPGGASGGGFAGEPASGGQPASTAGSPGSSGSPAGAGGGGAAGGEPKGNAGRTGATSEASGGCGCRVAGGRAEQRSMATLFVLSGVVARLARRRRRPSR